MILSRNNNILVVILTFFSSTKVCFFSDRVLSVNYIMMYCILQFLLTPLHLACWYGEEAMVELLLEHGADANAVDRVR